MFTITMIAQGNSNDNGKGKEKSKKEKTVKQASSEQNLLSNHHDTYSS